MSHSGGLVSGLRPLNAAPRVFGQEGRKGGWASAFGRCPPRLGVRPSDRPSVLARFRLYFVFIWSLARFCLDFVFIWSALAKPLRNLNLRHASSDPSRCDSMSPLRAAFQIHKIIAKYDKSVGKHRFSVKNMIYMIPSGSNRVDGNNPQG